MATPPMSRVVGHLRRAAYLQEAAGLRDEQLLESFLVHREDAAFEALLRRHGPMVLGVCRRVLHDRHDAEDAFQATFLVLIRKAASIGKREFLAAWLYRVAHRTALQARKAGARRKAKEKQVGDMAQKQDTGDEAMREMLPLLDQELSRLPDKYRVPIILCDLEGTTRKAAAQQLNLPERTLSTRLARARVMLAKRLARHGTTFTGSAVVAAAVTQNMASASVPISLMSATVKAAAVMAAGQTAAISAMVVAIMEGALKSMFLTKVKYLTSVLVLIAVLCAGATVSVRVLTADISGAQEVGTSAPAAQEIPKKDLGDDSKAPSRQLGRENPKIRQLAKKRLEALTKRLDIMTNLYKLSKLSIDPLIPAFSQLFHAELDYCESDQERLAICERSLAVLNGYEKESELRTGVGQFMANDGFLAVVALRLEVEIAYERARAKATRAISGTGQE
jgi:RNA polymerase sigma factor (sigma-70 family)